MEIDIIRAIRAERSHCSQELFLCDFKKINQNNQ